MVLSCGFSSAKMKAKFLFFDKSIDFIAVRRKSIYIHPEAPINTISCDEHVEVYLYDAQNHDDVDTDNWGDEDINLWTKAA